MTASKLNPNTFNGEERDGGYISKNARPTSAKSPEFRGKIYLTGVGWYWLSGWWRESKYGELLSLRAQEMTDEQAMKFCGEKARTTEAFPPRRGKSQSKPHGENGAAETEPEIPF